MPFLHRVPAIPPQQRASELWAGRLRTHPGAPLLMALLWKEHQTSSPKYTGTKAGFFWPVSDFMGFVDFLIAGLMWEAGSPLKVSSKVAALSHNRCTLLSQQLILHL